MTILLASHSWKVKDVLLFHVEEECFSELRTWVWNWQVINSCPTVLRKSNFTMRLPVIFMSQIWGRISPHDNKLFWWNGWPTKIIKPYFQLWQWSEILTTSTVRHVASRIWTCVETEFKIFLMKLNNTDKNTLHIALHNKIKTPKEGNGTTK